MTTATIGFISLGCPKATVDSERILTQLKAEGYVVSDSYADADLVIVNTCGFIESAVAESLEAITEALAENGRVIVTGCLGTRAKELQEQFPQLIAVTGPQDRPAVMAAVHAQAPPAHAPFYQLLPPGGIKLTPRHYAYLKISEGCNHQCTFCIIPSLRGRLVSRQPAAVLAEARALVEAGVRELLVVSQDTSAYGIDSRSRVTPLHEARRAHLTNLTRALGELGAWVRLHYVYPYPHVDELIPLMCEGNLLPYLDVPFQHANSRILRLMKRPASGEDNLERISSWRCACPDLTLRSTFIVGFPGETEAEFKELLDFLQAAQLDRVGCFAYSPVAGAAANALPDPLPLAVREARCERLMTVQAEISAQRLTRRIGKRYTVLVDEVATWGAVARSSAESPSIDGVVRIADAPDLVPGELVEVEITGADQHDLTARLVSAIPEQ
ncbi:MAG: 30S ribosomal protein S12 methylthiotransferase RimO [Arenicellales bacterium]|nr:30S ribosomal protein S12 methylthiotransferase RimO [Arenicellales bacterium]